VNDLLNIAFASLTRGWASGVSGTIIGTTNGGATWTSEISGVWGWFWGVTAASPTSAWVVGGDWFNHVAPVYHYNGTLWSHQYDITTTQSGQTIAAADESVVWAGGDTGKVAATTNGGSNWSNQTSGILVMINDLCALTPTSCWIAANEGTVLKTADGGTTWVPETTGTSDWLYGISMRDMTSGWAVGTNGTILRRTPGSALAESPGSSGPLRLTVSPVARSELSLHLQSGRESQVTIRLHDVTGRFERLLYSGPAQSAFSFRLADLPAGTWFVTVRAGTMQASGRFTKTD
jgi:photosystem II stability/assembly factor-like uncharacterized protein